MQNSRQMKCAGRLFRDVQRIGLAQGHRDFLHRLPQPRDFGFERIHTPRQIRIGIRRQRRPAARCAEKGCF